VAMRAEKRITHPESFDKYFLRSVPRGALPDAVVEGTMSSWARASEVKSTIAASIEAFRSDGSLVEFLQKLAIFLTKLDDSVVEPLLDVLAENILSLSKTQAEADQVFRIMLFLLNDKVRSESKQTSLARILLKIKPLDVAVRIVNALAESSVGTIALLQRSVDLGAMRKLIIDRFREEIVRDHVDIFEISARPTYVLYQIGHYDAETGKLVSDYAIDLCQQNPRRLGQLVVSFATQFDGKEFVLQFDQLKSVFDAQRLATIARRAGEAAFADEKERKAIEGLITAFDDASARSTTEK